ncbi:MAG TPA: nitroreductase family deazaflavin-dependent oxidoreductase [Candidatus Dormibacteraeota bacterium]|nr:nitroreductase family deazaflavin-dependent oxidoreductase [Candidatus Dormibacteraeota bacterium]
MSSFNQDLIADLRANQGKASSGPFQGRALAIVTTTGAKSREPRENPLVFSRSGDDLVVIASKGGAPNHPAWFHNLVATPRVKVEVDGEAFEAEARVAQGEEHDRLYAAHAALMPAFNEYQQRTTRKIPVVVLKRV